MPCDADRRVVHVVLTDDGRARVLAERARGEARRAEIFASLSAGERREAARLLERLADRRRGSAVKPTTRTLLPLAGAALAYSLAQTMVIPALPELQAEFHADPADATWLLTAFLLTSSVATPLLGRLGDMHGKERWLLISLAIFGVGSLIARRRRLAGRAHRRARPCRARAARSSRWPSASSATSSRASAWRPPSAPCRRCSGSAAAAGLVLAGLFVDHGSISWIFWLSVVTTALAALATWRWVPESPVRVRARIDWVGGVLLSLTLIALLLPISEGNAWGWTSGRVLGLFAATAVLAVVWAGGSCGSTTRS